MERKELADPLEIGGYIELWQNTGRMLHEGAFALNSARSCLACLIRARNIRRIVLPKYLCDSVRKVCENFQVKIRFYHLDESFLPMDINIDADEWLYIVNYYGQLTGDHIRFYKENHPNLIVDNVQAYFDEPVPDVDTIYSCRKFFGVSDGAFLYTDALLPEGLPRDVSYGRMGYLLGRYDTCASEHYADYTAHEQMMGSLPPARMSRLTENLLRGVDYDSARQRRTGNFAFLDEALHDHNRLKPCRAEGAFAYPLLLGHGAEVRKALIDQRIYVPILWPNVLEEAAADAWEYDLASNLLPLPCDHRYGKKEMGRVIEAVLRSL